MKTLYILIQTRSDYDDHETNVVGVTDDKRMAHAFLQCGSYSPYWSHEVDIVTLNVFSADNLGQIKDWLDPATNPMCECGHRLLHHRRTNHKGSCKHNMPQHHDPTQRHKCKGFRLAEKQPAVYNNEKIVDWRQS